MKNPKRSCESCCYWSDVIAEARDGQVLAMCLCDQGPRYSTMTSEAEVCRCHLFGEPIDRRAEA
jgi:hypothetical protein